MEIRALKRMTVCFQLYLLFCGSFIASSWKNSRSGLGAFCGSLFGCFIEKLQSQIGRFLWLVGWLLHGEITGSYWRLFVAR